MGSGTPKQFLELGGKKILRRTIDAFTEAVPEMRVITVLPREHIEWWKTACLNEAFDHAQTLVAGGLTRFHSVRNALEKVPDGAVVMIHDGVRPFVSKELICRMLSEISEEKPALVPVVPVVDTLRSADPSMPAPDRSKVLAVQTPQMFLSEDIKRAYGQAYDTNFTDDASVAERFGLKVSVTEGERLNMKITTPDDLLLAEAILSLRSPLGRSRKRNF